MGRNRKASAAHWGDDNVIELLAQLDRTVDGPRYSFANKNEKEIESIINSRLLSLEKKLKMQYTPNQIRRKLMDILKQGDINAEYNFRSVFSIGTSAMRSLDMNTKCMVQARLHDICMEGRQPRTSSQRLDSSLKLRRSTPGRRSTPPKREKNLRATPLGRARNWRGTTSITPSSASVSIKVTPFKSTHKKKFDPSTLSLDHPFRSTKRSDEVMPTIESTADPVSKQSFSPTEAIATPRSLEQSQEVENWSVCSGSPLAQRSTVLSDFSYKKIAPQVAIPESVYEDLQAEVSALRKESAKSKKEAQALERQYKELKALVAKTKGIGEKIEKELKANKDRVADLKAQQQNYAFLEPFFKLDTGKLAALDLPKIHKNQANIRSQLLGIFTMNGFQHFLGNGQHAHLSIESEDLQSLLRGLSHPDWSFNPYDTSNTIPVVHLVQSLIAVALRDWVFNAKFTCTTAMETPLVDAYRYHLSTICEPNILRSLDFAAHRWLLDQDMFKHVLLPKMASRFEERLLAALQPLMQHEYIGKLKDMLRPKFNAIFCAALELKTFVMVSKDMYHCIWPAPNSLFDPKTMETERDKFHPNDSEGYTDQMKVRLVLVPGLCVYGYDRQLVDYFGFRREGEVSTAEPQVLYKAVVLV